MFITYLFDKEKNYFFIVSDTRLFIQLTTGLVASLTCPGKILHDLCFYNIWSLKNFSQNVTLTCIYHMYCPVIINKKRNRCKVNVFLPDTFFKKVMNYKYII